MKNKINKFAQGEFPKDKPALELEQTSLVIQVAEGEVYKGKLSFFNRSQGKIRGMVYSSSSRLKLQRGGFDEEWVQIPFTYDGRGLAPFTTEKGSITLATCIGEVTIPFTALIERPYVNTKLGKISSLNEFKELAKAHPKEALALFRSAYFRNIIKYEEEKVRTLYENMRTWSLEREGMEEFLVGCRQKERLYLTVSDREKQYLSLEERIQDEILLFKNDWGYLKIKVTAQGDFIRPLQEVYTTEDFIEHTLNIPYLIIPSRLHRGNNYGTLQIKTLYETKTIRIVARREGEVHAPKRELEQDMAELLRAYLRIEAGQQEEEVWIQGAILKLQEWIQLLPENPMLPLYLARVYLLGNRKEDARWILDHHNITKEKLGIYPLASAYETFLTGCLGEEEKQRDKAVTELKKALSRHLDSPAISLMLMELDPIYQDARSRLSLLKRLYDRKEHSVWFYLECVRTFRKVPEQFGRMTEFEMHILGFMAKYHLVGEEVYRQAIIGSKMKKEYHPLLSSALISLYSWHESIDLLEAICMQLIKGNIVSPKAHIWYKRGVEKGLKIARLYEFFMLTYSGEKTHGKLPREILLYFRHGCQLPYKKAALLYAQVAEIQEEDPALFAGYQTQIKEFAKKELLKRHINEHLRVLYRRFLHEEEMDEDLLEAIDGICHSYQVTTRQEGMKYVLVLDHTGKIVQSAAYIDGLGAQVFLYDSDMRIIFEGYNGWHYADSFVYDTVRSFYEPRFLELCQQRKIIQEEQIIADTPKSYTLEELILPSLNSEDGEKQLQDGIDFLRDPSYAKNEQALVKVFYRLFKEGFYTNETLSFLLKNYTGPTKDMKTLWQEGRNNHLMTSSMAEKIITQMLFTESLFDEEEIFLDYLKGRPVLRIKQAYYAFVSHEYIVKRREVGVGFFEAMEHELQEDEPLADICKIALLHFYSKRCMGDQRKMLYQFMQEMVQKNYVFGFFEDFPEQWLQDVQLYDKVLVEYRAQTEGLVEIAYHISREAGEEVLPSENEILVPVYENIYVKEFTLFAKEELHYQFVERVEGEKKVTPMQTIRKERGLMVGRFGRLNQLILSENISQEQLLSYAVEDKMAEEIFVLPKWEEEQGEEE